jgi:cyanophycinase-like exopeptidase
MTDLAPGLVALLGSGETAPTSGVIYDLLARGTATPLQVAILETPAGFQPNAARVAGKVAEYLQVRLQNKKPQIVQLPARMRGTPSDPDLPENSADIRAADMIFLGPGSPTYTVRQLMGSLAWQRLQARQRRGARVVTASAATIAMGALALPVYEIYKVGSELHWQPGLNFFAPYGLNLVFVPHWNNTEGGEDLDTSRCYMGRERYAQLLALLPPELTVVGIDEHTGLVFDLAAQSCQVLGRGGVTLVRAGGEQRYERTSHFPLSELGTFCMPEPSAGLPPAVWESMATQEPAPVTEPTIPDAVLGLLEQRQLARANKDWPASDRIRTQLSDLGWQVRDTPAGPVVEPVAV